MNLELKKILVLSLAFILALVAIELTFIVSEYGKDLSKEQKIVYDKSAGLVPEKLLKIDSKEFEKANLIVTGSSILQRLYPKLEKSFQESSIKPLDLTNNGSILVEQLALIQKYRDFLNDSHWVLIEVRLIQGRSKIISLTKGELHARFTGEYPNSFLLKPIIEKILQLRFVEEIALRVKSGLNKFFPSKVIEFNLSWIEEIKKLIITHNFKPIFIVIPPLEKKSPDLTEKHSKTIEMINQQIPNSFIIDLYSELSSEQLVQFRQSPSDSIHFNLGSEKLIVDLIKSKIIEFNK